MSNYRTIQEQCGNSRWIACSFLSWWGSKHVWIWTERQDNDWNPNDFKRSTFQIDRGHFTLGCSCKWNADYMDSEWSLMVWHNNYWLERLFPWDVHIVCMVELIIWREKHSCSQVKESVKLTWKHVRTLVCFWHRTLLSFFCRVGAKYCLTW